MAIKIKGTKCTNFSYFANENFLTNSNKNYSYFLRLQVLKRLKIENIAKRTLNDILKKLFKGVGLPNLALIRCNMARGLLGRSCLKSFNIKINKIPNFFFRLCDDFFKIKVIPYPTIWKVW